MKLLGMAESGAVIRPDSLPTSIDPAKAESTAGARAVLSQRRDALPEPERAIVTAWERSGCSLWRVQAGWEYLGRRLAYHCYLGDRLPYDAAMPTWGWSPDTLALWVVGDEVLPQVGAISVDPHGPGLGVHVCDVRLSRDGRRAEGWLMQGEPDTQPYIVLAAYAAADRAVLFTTDRDQPLIPVTGTAWRYILASMQALLSQRILEPIREGPPPRHVRRRENLPPPSQWGLSITTFRRLVPMRRRNAAAEGRERDKHWSVSRHRRRLTDRATGEQRIVWVREHLKGNLSAPYYRSMKVGAVTR